MRTCACLQPVPVNVINRHHTISLPDSQKIRIAPGKRYIPKAKYIRMWKDKQL